MTIKHPVKIRFICSNNYQECNFKRLRGIYRLIQQIENNLTTLHKLIITIFVFLGQFECTLRAVNRGFCFILVFGKLYLKLNVNKMSLRNINFFTIYKYFIILLVLFLFCLHNVKYNLTIKKQTKN